MGYRGISDYENLTRIGYVFVRSGIKYSRLLLYYLVKDLKGPAPLKLEVKILL